MSSTEAHLTRHHQHAGINRERNNSHRHAELATGVIVFQFGILSLAKTRLNCLIPFPHSCQPACSSSFPLPAPPTDSQSYLAGSLLRHLSAARFAHHRLSDLIHAVSGAHRTLPRPNTVPSFPPDMPRTPVMSLFSSAFTSLAPKTPTSGKLGLPVAEEEPLKPEYDNESCTLKIEGMTCGACVEVRIPTSMVARLLNGIVVYRKHA